ncbi:MAG: YiiX/YebB-like N1pC/P60 family cysteine hydrolase [Bacteroidetes bacterium]|nr:YiiX/YebB-like N1pC/P60 family cysteine hydrolase [Bacteroidota bacterium]
MKRYLFHPLFLLFFVWACQIPPAPKKWKDPVLLSKNFRLIDSTKPLIQSGDVIFRNGDDDVSHAARSMNRMDTTFSHCGLIQIEGDTIFVYHSIGGVYNPDMHLRRDPIDSFCNPLDNNAFGVYRYNLNGDQLKRLSDVVHQAYRSGLRFDLYFNYQSDDVMYCSEFVFKSLNRSADGAFTKYIRLDTMPFGVTTDDIYLNENCRLVKRQYFLQ